MKICSVVGIRKSGKTTVVTELVKELKKREYRVGTVKTVFCPNFSLDQEGSNTDRHKRAGADIVGIKGKREMSILYPGGMDDNVFFPKFEVDILLLEGDYEAGVPRIVCAHKRADAMERINEYTIAVSGRIGAASEAFGSLPVLDVRTAAVELANLITALPEVAFPIPILETPETVSSFCQCGCHKTEKRCAAAAPTRHLFLTGEKQIGKSTILQRVIASLSESPVGYQTRPFVIEGVRKGHILHGLQGLAPYENDTPISIRIGENKMIAMSDTFETLGVQILEKALASEAWMLADEAGRLERKAEMFQKLFFDCLDRKKMVLGVLQKCDSEFVERIRARADVRVLEVTANNREEVFEEVLAFAKGRSE